MWYFVKDDQPFGPIETGALNKKFRDGSLGPNNLVWQPGMHDWAKASTVVELWSEPCAPPLIRGPEVAESVPHTNYAGILLGAGSFVCLILLLCSLYSFAGGYWGSIDLRHEVTTADVFLRQPEKLSERLATHVGVSSNPVQVRGSKALELPR